MQVREFYDRLEARIPKSLSCDWDNDGLMCCPCSDTEVSKVLVALDVTGPVVEYAKEKGYDVILSHHPLIYKGLKSLDDNDYVSSKLISLAAAGISVMSFHTRLDAVEGGVNDKLAELLGLSDTEPLYEEGIPLGRVGNLSVSMRPEEFSKNVKEILGIPFVLLSDANMRVRRVAVVGGNGRDLIPEARRAGADTFVSGRLDYHSMTDAPDQKVKKMNLIEAGHFFTEDPVCSVLRDFTLEIDSNIECEIYSSNAIKVV